MMSRAPLRSPPGPHTPSATHHHQHAQSHIQQHHLYHQHSASNHALPIQSASDEEKQSVGFDEDLHSSFLYSMYSTSSHTSASRAQQRQAFMKHYAETEKKNTIFLSPTIQVESKINTLTGKPFHVSPSPRRRAINSSSSSSSARPSSSPMHRAAITPRNAAAHRNTAHAQSHMPSAAWSEHPPSHSSPHPVEHPSHSPSHSLSFYPPLVNAQSYEHSHISTPSFSPPASPFSRPSPPSSRKFPPPSESRATPRSHLSASPVRPPTFHDPPQPQHHTPAHSPTRIVAHATPFHADTHVMPPPVTSPTRIVVRSSTNPAAAPLVGENGKVVLLPSSSPPEQQYISHRRANSTDSVFGSSRALTAESFDLSDPVHDQVHAIMCSLLSPHQVPPALPYITHSHVQCTPYSPDSQHSTSANTKSVEYAAPISRLIDFHVSAQTLETLAQQFHHLPCIVLGRQLEAKPNCGLYIMSINNPSLKSSIVDFVLSITKHSRQLLWSTLNHLPALVIWYIYYDQAMEIMCRLARLKCTCKIAYMDEIERENKQKERAHASKDELEEPDFESMVPRPALPFYSIHLSNVTSYDFGLVAVLCAIFRAKPYPSFIFELTAEERAANLKYDMAVESLRDKWLKQHQPKKLMVLKQAQLMEEDPAKARQRELDESLLVSPFASAPSSSAPPPVLSGGTSPRAGSNALATLANNPAVPTIHIPWAHLTHDKQRIYVKKEIDMIKSQKQLLWKQKQKNLNDKKVLNEIELRLEGEIKAIAERASVSQDQIREEVARLEMKSDELRDAKEAQEQQLAHMRAVLQAKENQLDEDIQQLTVETQNITQHQQKLAEEEKQMRKYVDDLKQRQSELMREEEQLRAYQLDIQQKQSKLSNEEKALNKQEAELQAEKNRLQLLSDEIARREEETAAKQKELEEKEHKLQQTEQEIASTQQSLEEMKLNAEKLKAETEEKVARDMAELRAEEARVAQMRSDEEKRFREKFSREMSELSSTREALEVKQNELLEKQNELRANQDEFVNTMERDRAALNEKRRELARQREELDEKQRKFEEEMMAKQLQFELEAKQKRDALQMELAEAKQKSLDAIKDMQAEQAERDAEALRRSTASYKEKSRSSSVFVKSNLTSPGTESTKSRRGSGSTKDDAPVDPALVNSKKGAITFEETQQLAEKKLILTADDIAAMSPAEKRRHDREQASHAEYDEMYRQYLGISHKQLKKTGPPTIYLYLLLSVEKCDNPNLVGHGTPIIEMHQIRGKISALITESEIGADSTHSFRPMLVDIQKLCALQLERPFMFKISSHNRQDAQLRGYIGEVRINLTEAQSTPLAAIVNPDKMKSKGSYKDSGKLKIHEAGLYLDTTYGASHYPCINMKNPSAPTYTKHTNCLVQFQMKSYNLTVPGLFGPSKNVTPFVELYRKEEDGSWSSTAAYKSETAVGGTIVWVPCRIPIFNLCFDDCNRHILCRLYHETSMGGKDLLSSFEFSLFDVLNEPSKDFFIEVDEKTRKKSSDPAKLTFSQCRIYSSLKDLDALCANADLQPGPGLKTKDSADCPPLGIHAVLIENEKRIKEAHKRRVDEKNGIFNHHRSSSPASPSPSSPSPSPATASRAASPAAAHTPSATRTKDEKASHRPRESIAKQSISTKLELPPAALRKK